MGDRLQYLGVVQARSTGLIQNIRASATMSSVHVQRERQDRRCMAITGLATLCIGKVGRRQARRTSGPGVRRQTIVAPVGRRDGMWIGVQKGPR